MNVTTLGSGFYSPANPAGLLANSALYTRPGQQLMAALPEKRPQFAGCLPSRCGGRRRFSGLLSSNAAPTLLGN